MCECVCTGIFGTDSEILAYKSSYFFSLKCDFTSRVMSAFGTRFWFLSNLKAEFYIFEVNPTSFC